MNQRKLVLSIALGALLTLGLLATLGLNRDTALASPDAARVDHQASQVETVRSQDAVSGAHVVVQFARGGTAVRPVTWTDTITRASALKAAGFAVEHEDDAICSIDGEGCPDTDCFCPDNLWAQGQWDGTAWDTAWPPPELVDGDVIAFRNGTQPDYSDWGLTGLLPGAPTFVAASDALEWMRGQQQPDGGFSSLNGTAEVLLATSANRIDAATWEAEGPSLLANMLSEGAALANLNAAGVGKLAVGLSAQESCWPIGAMTPLHYYDPVSGTFDNDTLYHAWAILGASAISETVPLSATQYLRGLQQSDGGWEWAVGQGTDTNATALALQALRASGDPITSTAVVSGLNYLAGAQNGDGGFPYSPDSPWGTDSDANSTAYVLQALLATGEDPLTGTWAISDTNPVSYLLGLQLPSGAFEWQAGSGASVFATRQVIPALLHQPFPLQIGALEDCYGLSGRVLESHHTVGPASPRDDGAGIAGVTVWAQGSGDLYFGTTVSPTGAYSISVPITGSYTLSPVYGRYVFSPTERTVQVTGEPGDIASVGEFLGELRIHLPLILRGYSG